jgi:hypothetical protein
VTWKIWKDWIPKNKTEPVWVLYNSAKEWFLEKSKLIAGANDWDDPVVTDHEIDTKSDALEKLARKVDATERPRAPRPVKNVTRTNRTAKNHTNVNQTVVNRTEGEPQTEVAAENDATIDRAKPASKSGSAAMEAEAPPEEATTRSSSQNAEDEWKSEASL